MTTWVVREGNEGQGESKALAEGVATMGYRDMRDPASFGDRDSMREWYRQQYSDLPDQKIISEVTQIWDFAQNMQQGDLIVLPCKKQPIVWVGRVTGPYRFDKAGPDRHIRPVNWLDNIPRSMFDPQSSNSLDLPGTIYRLKEETTDEIKTLLDRKQQLLQLYKELVLTYAKVAKNVADGVISCPHIKFEHEMESKEALKSLLDDFLLAPTVEKFQKFWNRPYIWAAAMGGNPTNLIKKNGLDKITNVLREIDSATEYNPTWEKELGAYGALSEFWGKLKDRPIRNSCSNNALVFLGYSKVKSYPDFLVGFKQFLTYYQSLIGQERITQYPIEIELDQLFNFVDKATNTDLIENPNIIDPDIKTLYAVKKHIEELLHPSDVPPVSAPIYWIEKRNLKRYPYLESTDYALGRALLSGQTSKPDAQGRVKDIRKTMREVKPGDVVLHLINNKCFSGISVAASAVDDKLLWPEENKPPSKPAYVVWLQNYTELEPPIYKSEFLGDDPVFERLVQISESYAGREGYSGGLFYDTKNRKIGQGGYLTRAPPEAVDILNEIYTQKTGHQLPHIPPPQRRSWIFQAVPERYNLVARLPSLGEEPWSANKRRELMRVGDTVYYWQAGKDAGVYGVGTIVTYPQKALDTEFGEWGVITRIDRFLGSRYIPKQTFVDDPVLQRSAIMTSHQGTNFLLTSEEADAITKYMPAPLSPTNEIFYGPPGTGKTYNVVNRALELVHDDRDYCKYSKKTRPELDAEFNLLQKKGQIEFITFHQSYSYEEFVEGIRPVLDTDEKAGGLDYKLKTGVFRNIVKRARAPENRARHFVLVIDEINRG
ncbi:MAG: hypothetical protein ACXV76_13500, partial [Halobacteriota archaeon]